MITPSAQPPARVWTRGFSALFVGIVLASGLACLAAIFFIRRAAASPPAFGQPDLAFGPFRVAELALLLSQGVLALVCLAGSFAASSRLVRVGCYLLAGAALCELGSYGPFVANIRPVIFWDIALHLPTGAAFLNLLGLACLSYGLVPWSRARDGWLMLLLVLLSGAGVAVVWSRNDIPLSSSRSPALNIACTLSSTVWRWGARWR